MNKQEFESRATRPINDSDYQKVEYVYICHPGIDRDSGMDQLVALYSEYGMQIIEHMVEQADRDGDIWREMIQCQERLEHLRAEHDALMAEIMSEKTN